MKLLLPYSGFRYYCRWQIRKGLMFRYWIALPWMYRKELKFIKELEQCLNEKETIR